MEKYSYVTNFVKFISQKIYIIIIVTVIFGVLGVLYVRANPRIAQYEATIKLAINSDYETVNSYADIAMSNDSLEKIVAKLDNEYSKSEIKSNLSASVLSNGKIVTITYVNSDQTESEKIVSIAKDVSLDSFKDVFKITNDEIHELGAVNSEMKELGIGKKAVAFFVLVGAGLGLAVVWFMYDLSINENNIKKRQK